MLSSVEAFGTSPRTYQHTYLQVSRVGASIPVSLALFFRCYSFNSDHLSSLLWQYDFFFLSLFSTPAPARTSYRVANILSIQVFSAGVSREETPRFVRTCHSGVRECDDSSARTAKLQTTHNPQTTKEGRIFVSTNASGFEKKREKQKVYPAPRMPHWLPGANQVLLSCFLFFPINKF